MPFVYQNRMSKFGGRSGTTSSEKPQVLAENRIILVLNLMIIY